MSKLQETTSYFDENAGRVRVKSDTVNFDPTKILPKLFKNCSYFNIKKVCSADATM